MPTASMTRRVEHVADRGHLAVHHAARPDHVGPRLRLRDRDPPVPLERGVVVDVPVAVQHPAVAVVRVLVQAEVGDDDVLVTQLVPERPERALRDPVGVPGLGSLCVLALRNSEQHESADAARGDLCGLLAERLQRVLGLSRHGGDRDRFGDAFLHEQRRDQLTGSQVGLADQRAEGGGATHASGSLLREAHARMLARCRGVNARSTAATRPSIVCGRATAATRMPRSRASRAVTGPMHTTFGSPRTTPTAPTNPRTVEALVNVIASTRPSRSAARASAGNDRAIRVR